ncbi:MAG: carotenoid 1,2-hydratase [Comamonas sp.]
MSAHNPLSPTPSLPRRRALRTLGALGLLGGIGGIGALLPLASAWALPPKPLAFPRDFGSHPDLGTEWWYITGHVQAGGRPWGFQLTFFRSRVETAQALRSAFAAQQLLFAHVALCDVQGQRLLHDQRMARAGFGLAEAATADTAVHIQDWQLTRQAVPGQNAAQASRYSAKLQAADFALELELATTQPVLLQGQAGLSRKGPLPEQASYYYSQPQLAVTGHITVGGQRLAIDTPPANAPAALHNRAWLDHECSTALMHPEAEGWDWIGMNLADGSALTAFHLRRRDGSALWGGGSLRTPGASPRVFTSTEVEFTPLAWWTSPATHTHTRYPVRWRVDTPSHSYVVRAQVAAQELDSRATTGAVYWEGLSDLMQLPPGGDALSDSLPLVGRGYLEMTGYASRLRM